MASAPARQTISQSSEHGETPKLSLLNKITIHSVPSDLAANDGETSKGSTGLKCTKCNFTSKYTHSLRRHVLCVHDNQRHLRCSKCSTMYSSEERLLAHVKKAHSEPVPCEICSKSFRSKQALTSHRKLKHRKGHLQCTVEGCGKAFADKNHYDDHMNSHNKVKLHMCPTCNTAYYYRNNLNRHMKTNCANKEASMKPESYMCDLCSKVFICRNTFNDHMNCTHKQGNQFQCACGQAYYHRGSYYRHMRKCMSSKDSKDSKLEPDVYMCEICAKIFSSSGSLTEHARGKHKQRDPFLCICGNTFMYKSSYSTHKKSCSVHIK